MAAFITDLWESIFVAGPTPTLIVATNAAFAGLQLILFLLLLATYSIHFVILSFLSAGLWFAINWFVRELSVAQALEDEKVKSRSDEARSGSDSETEAETVIDTEDIGTRNKAVEVLERKGELKARGDRSSGSKSEMSTEDEWEKVSENENEKDK